LREVVRCGNKKCIIQGCQIFRVTYMYQFLTFHYANIWTPWAVFLLM
jgi:hypothetical protein